MPGCEKNKPLAAIIAAAALLLFSSLCTGCMSRNAAELLCLPQLPEEYVELQNAINEVLKTGAVYSAPVSGSHRQSVQLCDLNGDGTGGGPGFFQRSGRKAAENIHLYKKR